MLLQPVPGCPFRPRLADSPDRIAKNRRRYPIVAQSVRSASRSIPARSTPADRRARLPRTADASSARSPHRTSHRQQAAEVRYRDPTDRASGALAAQQRARQAGLRRSPCCSFSVCPINRRAIVQHEQESELPQESDYRATRTERRKNSPDEKSTICRRAPAEKWQSFACDVKDWRGTALAVAALYCR